MARTWPVLEESEAGSDPFALFAAWFSAAGAAEVPLPEAMAVATCGAHGRPSLRMVLMKDYDERGFVFYTDLRSRKSVEIAANSAVALLFHWSELGRQVRVEGAAEPVSTSEADEYFATRPRGSQLGARASQQSAPIADRAELEARVEAVAEQLEGGPVERPGTWSGWRVRPERFEFWQQREDRLHDRLVYAAAGDGWDLGRIQP